MCKFLLVKSDSSSQTTDETFNVLTAHDRVLRSAMAQHQVVDILLEPTCLRSTPGRSCLPCISGRLLWRRRPPACWSNFRFTLC